MCLTGDKEALNMFYTRFAPKMMGVIRRYVHNAEDAEDILHDGFIVAYTRMRDVRDAGRVEYWLASIMRNLALQFLREQDIAVILHDIPEVEETQEFEELMDIEMLESLIHKLPPGYQRVFRLSVLENKSHKEIAKILGIEPTTSASQLFHAKVMMRRFIKEYKVRGGVLLLFLLVCGLVATMFLQERPSDADLIAENKDATETVREDTGQNASRETPGGNLTAMSPVTPVSTIARQPADSESEHEVVDFRPPVDGDIKADDVVNGNVADNDIADNDNEVNDNDTVPHMEPGSSEFLAFADEGEALKRRDYGWTLSVGSDFVLGSSAGAGIVGRDPTVIVPGGDPVRPPVTDPDDPEDSENSKVMKAARATRGSLEDYSQVSHHNDLPISFSVSVAKRLNRTFSLESGLRYTYLHSRYEESREQSHCHWHYIGIPLKLNISTYTRGRMSLYGSVGVSVNFPVYSRGISDSSGSSSYWLPTGNLDAKVMWSVAASYGISIRLSNAVSVFVEPTVQYMPPVRTSVPNYWTDSPWNFMLPLGLRFNW